MEREAGVEDGDRAVAGLDPCRVGDRVALAQRDPRLVRGQAVEGGAVERGEAFEPVKRALFLEDMSEDRERVGRGEAARAAAGAFLPRIGLRRAVGAEEEARIPRGGGAAQREAVAL